MSPTIRPLTPPEQHALAAARLRAVEHAPYLARALFAVTPLAADGLGTMAVDAHWRLYIDPATMTEWGPANSAGVLIHEVGHLVRDHAGRARDLPGRYDHDLWNEACDASLNDDLIAAGIPLPKGAITPEAFGLPARGIEETYYAHLTAQQPPTPAAALDAASGRDAKEDLDPGTGCGSGAGGPAAAWEAPADAAPGQSPARAQIVRRMVATDIIEHTRNSPGHGTGRGDVPAGWTGWAHRELTPPTIAWRTVLASAIRRALATTAGRTDYTYTRPGRRHIPDIITPAMRTPRLHVTAVLDTSASMGDPDITAALAEVNGIIRAAGINRMPVLSCDAAVADTTHARTATDVRVAGRGGTDMRTGITAALTARPRPDVVIVLTDGHTPWPATPLRARLVIALIGDHAAPAHSCPPWATTVRVA